MRLQRPWAGTLLAIVLGSGCATPLPPGEDSAADFPDLDRRAVHGDLSILPVVFEGLDSADPGERSYAYRLFVFLWEFHLPGRPAPWYRPWDPRPERLERIEELRPGLERIGDGANDSSVVAGELDTAPTRP